MRLHHFIALAVLVPAVAGAQRKADFSWEKTLANGSDVEIHNVSGDVRVTPSTTGRVEVYGFNDTGSRFADPVRTVVVETSHGIVVCVVDADGNDTCDDRGLRSRGRDNHRDRGSMNLEIHVPATMNVSASSVSGDVSVSGVQGEDLRTSTVSGNIRVERARTSRFRGSTVSGDIDARIEALTGRGDLTFSTVSGDVTLELPKNLDVDLTDR